MLSPLNANRMGLRIDPGAPPRDPIEQGLVMSTKFYLAIKSGNAVETAGGNVGCLVTAVAD